MMGAYTSGLLRSHTLFVDVGAARAYQSDLARAFGHPVIGVDCRHDEAATLARHFANDTRTVIVHTCLSDRVGEPVKLYRAGDSSSAVQVNVAHGIEKRKASHEHEKTEVVRSTTLDDLLGHSLGASEDTRIVSNANPPEVPNWCDGYATAAWPCTHGHAHIWSCTYMYGHAHTHVHHMHAATNQSYVSISWSFAHLLPAFPQHVHHVALFAGCPRMPRMPTLLPNCSSCYLTAT